MAEKLSLDPILARVESMRDQMVALTAELVRIPTVNPPGHEYEACAWLIGDRLAAAGASVEFITAPWEDAAHPRVNVIGRFSGAGARPCLHLNSHFDVVPPGEGWSMDPFGGEVRDGRIYGRGASDMKSGLAASIIAVEAVLAEGMPLRGSIDLSGTVDEESGGLPGVAHLCEIGRISSDNTDFAIIPEPFGPDRVCVGHKGVYWCDITAHGVVAHGSMPHLGRSAIDDMTVLLHQLRSALGSELADRITAAPVVPEASRASSMNVNAVHGGQPTEGAQSPCVADRCVATIDRRFIAEESLGQVRAEIAEVVDRVARETGARFTIDDRLEVDPVQAPEGSPLVGALSHAIGEVRGREAALVASPGTYDQKHFARIAGVHDCVAYGPGPLEEAHQPDESCSIDDLVATTQVLAATISELVGPSGRS